MGESRHPFIGRLDRWCERCHKPDRDPIHQGGDAHVERRADAADTHVTGPAGATPPAPAGPPPGIYRTADDWGFGADAGDEREPPLLERVPWRIGVLDKDLVEDPDAIVDNASWIAGWYVHDCAELLGLVKLLPPPEVAPAGPPDLDQAIQAASLALLDLHGHGRWLQQSFDALAQVAVQAAAPILQQATWSQTERLMQERQQLYERLDKFEQAIVDALGELRWDKVSAALITLHASALDLARERPHG